MIIPYLLLRLGNAIFLKWGHTTKGTNVVDTSSFSVSFRKCDHEEYEGRCGRQINAPFNNSANLRHILEDVVTSSFKKICRTQGIGMFAPADFQDLLEGMDPRVRRATKEKKARKE